MKKMMKPGGYHYYPTEEKEPDFWEKFVNFDYHLSGDLNPKNAYFQYRLNTTLNLKETQRSIIQEIITEGENRLSTTGSFKFFYNHKPYPTSCQNIECFIDIKPYGFNIAFDYVFGDTFYHRARKKIKYPRRITYEYHVRIEDKNPGGKPRRADMVTDYNLTLTKETLIALLNKRHVEFLKITDENIKLLDSINQSNYAAKNFQCQLLDELKIEVKKSDKNNQYRLTSKKDTSKEIISSENSKSAVI